MYSTRFVCSCMKVTLTDIKNSIENGASSVGEVCLATKAGGKCGACLDNAKEIIGKLLEAK